MACIINGQSDQFVIYSQRRGQWVWVKGRDAFEYLSASTIPKLKYDDGILFNLLPGGWIQPHPETILKVGWAQAADYLTRCFKGLMRDAEFSWVSQKRSYHKMIDGVDEVIRVDCMDVEWKARLSPFLVKYHPIHYQHPDWYPSFGLCFYFIWEAGERGLFATQADERNDFSFMNGRKLQGNQGDPEDFRNYAGYWDWREEQNNRKPVSLTPTSRKKTPRKPRGGSRRVNGNGELALGSLTRDKESIFDPNSRASSRDLGSARA